ncbi:NAD(P)/FAD-dependent oxidoreductase [Thalassospira sp. MA62]|nr:NAD(P)/FAD-dependent oxidoreductase [Thalassospira sp. MA62]
MFSAQRFWQCSAITDVKPASPLPLNDPAALATAIKNLPINIKKPRPLDEAISTAGGVAWEELDDTFQLIKRPGTYCLGEMVDWEAPTGGYLLTGCFANHCSL